MRRQSKVYLTAAIFLLLLSSLPILPIKSSDPSIGSNIIKNANVQSNQLIDDTFAYYTFPEPDYAWKTLKDLGITLLQVEGGPEGNVLHIQLNENHPYGYPYDPDWAQNLDSFLSKADSYGIKVVFLPMGCNWGNNLGIVPPMQSEARYDRYTNVTEALRLIDKLGGNNSLHKNFLNDSRVPYWIPIDEARIDGPEYSDVKDWTIQTLQRIRSYGGKTSVCVNDLVYGDSHYHNYTQTYPYVISVIGPYVDYLQAHIFCDDLWVAASNNPNYDMYTNAYNEFSNNFKAMAKARGSFGLDKLQVTIGCGYTTWEDFRGTITTTSHQQAMYFKACFDAAKENGIEIICYHAPFLSLSYRSLGFIEPDGTKNQEAYDVFKYNGTVNATYSPINFLYKFYNTPIKTTSLAINSPSTNANTPTQISAKLVDDNGQELQGMYIYFQILNGSPLDFHNIGYSVTDLHGNASITYTTTLAGSWQIRALFLGTTYVPHSASSNGVLTSTAQGTTITIYVDPTSVEVGGTVTIAATLKDSVGNPLNNQLVGFSVRSTSLGLVNTDSKGRAIMTFSATLNPGTYTVQTSFIGSNPYLSSAGSANLIVTAITPTPGSLRITVKDSSGNVISGATVTSSKQPSGQAALSGTTASDGTITFPDLVLGNYTLQVSKSGYVSGSAQGVVASGAKTELSTALQAQPPSGIPGFPFEAKTIGVLLCIIWFSFISHPKIR